MATPHHPAAAQTGSAMLHAERLHARQDSDEQIGDDDDDDDADGEGTDSGNGYIATGCAPIDEALRGGFSRGEIATIAAADPAVRSALTYRLIATHLSRQRHGEALLVDAHGAFSAPTLRDIMTETLLGGVDGGVDGGDDDGGSSSSSSRGLRMRLPLPHEGYMYEVVTTAREPEEKKGAQAGAQAEEEEKKEEEEEEQAVEGRVLAMLDRVKLTRVFDLVGMIDTVGELHAMCRAHKGESADTSEVITAAHDVSNTGGKGGGAAAAARKVGIDLIIIDDLAAVLQPILSNNLVEAQALLASFHRTLLRLARTYDVCVVVFNTVSGPSHRKLSRYGGEGSERKQGDDHVSMFPSVRGRPALGRAFAHLVDLSLLVSELPRSKADAEIAYEDGSAGRMPKDWRALSLLEVLKDRTGKRLNRFALAEIKNLRVKAIGR